MTDTLHAVKHYQRVLERSAHDHKRMLRCIEKLYQLPVTVQLLQDTGVGRTVNALRKGEGEVANAARTVIAKWKQMVADEEEELENQQAERNEHRHTSPPPPPPPTVDRISERNHSRKYEREESHSYNIKEERRSDSDTDRIDDVQQQEKHERRHDGEDRKRKYYEEKEYTRPKPSKYDSSDNNDSDDDEDEHREEPSSENEESDAASDHVQNEDRQDDTDEEPASYIPSAKPTYHESPKHNSSVERHSRSSERPDKHKSKHGSGGHGHNSGSGKSLSRDEVSTSKSKIKHKSKGHSHKRDSVPRDDSEKRAKRSNEEKKEKYHDRIDKESKSHKEKHEKDDKIEKTSHSSSRSKHSSNTENHSHKSEESKHHSHKSKHSDKEKHDSNKRKKSDKHRNDGDKTSSNSHGDKDAKDKHKSKHGDSSMHESKSKNSSREKSYSENKPEVKPKQRDSSSEHTSDSKKRKLVHCDDGIDSGSGATFAEALGMISPNMSKKKSKHATETTESPKEASTSNSSNNSYNKSGATNDTPSLLKDSLKLSPLPPLSVSISALPDISPNYVPRPAPKLVDGPYLHISEEEALSVAMNTKNQRTKVFSGNKSSHGYIPSLYELCVIILQENISSLEYTGGVPYEILKPVIDKATPDQLFVLEHYNPYLIEDTDALWKIHCNKRFRTQQRQEMESWRDMYMRCCDEQEARLKSLTANIKLAQDKSQPVRQTKMAYVDSVVKPPRNIARKQALHGTARKPVASPAARVASLANNTVFNGATVSTVGTSSSVQPVRTPGGFIKPKKAPLMQKALQLIKGRYKR